MLSHFEFSQFDLISVRLTMLEIKQNEGFTTNPADGQRIAYRRSERRSEGQIWVLENFLPEYAASK